LKLIDLCSAFFHYILASRVLLPCLDHQPVPDHNTNRLFHYAFSHLDVQY